jgi:hypothetical protein
MKKEIVLLVTLIGAILVFIIIDNWIFRGIVVFTLLCTVLFVIGNRKYCRFMRKRIPNIMKDLTRNYDKIVLGKIYNDRLDQTNIDEKKLDLTNYCRNLYTDILILKRWYSLLKVGGSVCFNIDCRSKKYLFDNKISVYDDRFLHQVTMLEHKKDIYSKKYKISKCCKAILFLFLSYFDKNNKNSNLSKNEICCLKQKIEEINSFCEIRNIKVIYNFYNCSKDNI